MKLADLDANDRNGNEPDFQDFGETSSSSRPEAALPAAAIPNPKLFFTILFELILKDGQHFIELRMKNRSGRVTSQYFRSLPALLDAVSKPPDDCDFYFGVHPRNQQRGTNEDVDTVMCLYADVDYKKFPGGEEEASAIFDKFPLKSNAIVLTGHGLHVYHFLERPLSLTDSGTRAEYQRILRGYQRALRSDLVDDLARCMRVPGSFNCKEVKPVPTGIAVFDCNRLYSLDDFKQFATQPGPNQPSPAQTPQSFSVAEGHRNNYLTSLGGAMRHWGATEDAICVALLEQNRAVCKPPLPEPEVSGIARSVAKYSPGEINSLISLVRSGITQYPDPAAKEAFHGLAGRIVRYLDPHTESDPIAVLIQLLVTFGNIVGRGPHFKVESDTHRLNLFVTLVGDTAKARKGTSLNRVKSLYLHVDRNYVTSYIRSGLSTGEGLINMVRDQSDPQDAVDKRALVIEPEFASVLQVAGRQGNTLTMVMRNLWDSGNAESNPKNKPIKTTGAHVSIVGHVTADELTRYLTRTEMGDGFANRFLWACVRRSKNLPHGGNADERALQRFSEELRQVVEFARGVGAMSRSEEANRRWEEIYTELADAKPGLLGAIVARGEAQVLRLSCIYALLDKSTKVNPDHLNAAYALWKYCEASCAHIFGGKLGDPTADAILKALRASANGLTRAQISNTLHHNVPADQIQRALGVLAQKGLAKSMTETSSGPRPIERWVAQ